MKSHFFWLFLLCSCSSAQQKELPLNGNYYTIDLDGKKETSILFSSIFKNVQTIILETNKDCLIGNINEFQVFEEFVYVLDRLSAKSLFVFNMDGRFVRKIGNLGRGPGEYVQVIDFTLDTENRFIFLLDRGNRVHKYLLDGTYVNSITIQMPSANIAFIQYYRNRLYASVLAWNSSKDDFMLLETDPIDGKIISRALPLTYNKGWGENLTTGHSFFMSRLNDPPRFSQLFMDYIVTVGETITPYIELKSKSLFTKKDIENLPANVRIDEKLRAIQSASKIFDVHSFIENNDLIIFRCQNGSGVFFTVVFHKKTESVKLANYLNNDLIFRKDKGGIFGKFVFSDTKGAYEIIPPIILNRFLETIKNNEVVPGLDKLDQLMKLNEESNPIILFYEFK